MNSKESTEDNKTTLNMGNIRHGRVSMASFSRVVADVSQALGIRERLSASLDAAQEAGDNLKAYGVDSSIVDRVMWLINEPFPLSAIGFIQRVIKSKPIGAGLHVESGKLTVVRQELGLRSALSWLDSGFGQGSAMIARTPDLSKGGVSGVGGKDLCASVTIGAWRTSIQSDLMEAGISEQEAKRFIAGHELGHVVFRASGHGELFEKLGEELGLGKPGHSAKVSDLVADTAEELFCDALGSIAARPGYPAAINEAASAMRKKNSIGILRKSVPIYLGSKQDREGMEERVAGKGWKGEDGGIDLAAACFAAGVARWTNASNDQARQEVAKAFEVVVGREWLPPRCSPSGKMPPYKTAP